MQTLLFSVTKPDLIGEVLQRIQRLLRPRSVGPLYPDTTLPEMKLNMFVALDDATDLASSAEALQQIPGVADVETPAMRKLIA